MIAVSAAGHKIPPVFIIQGKYVMSNWFLPLDSEVYQHLPPPLSSLLREDWFPRDGVVICTENGSMTMAAMPLFISHLEKFVRTIVPSPTSYCVTIDGHSSRKGIDWIEQCIKNNAEVAQSPADTSHFLHPCDADVNKNFKSNIRSVRDDLCDGLIVDTKCIWFKLMCVGESLGNDHSRAC